MYFTHSSIKNTIRQVVFYIFLAVFLLNSYQPYNAIDGQVFYSPNSKRYKQINCTKCFSACFPFKQLLAVNENTKFYSPKHDKMNCLNIFSYFLQQTSSSNKSGNHRDKFLEVTVGLQAAPALTVHRVDYLHDIHILLPFTAMI